MEDLLRFIITPLLTVPDKLKITANESSVTIDVDPTDIGRIIGKHGTVINAIRTIAKTFSTNHHLPQPTILLTTPPIPAKKD